MIPAKQTCLKKRNISYHLHNHKKGHDIIYTTLGKVGPLRVSIFEYNGGKAKSNQAILENI